MTRRTPRAVAASSLAAEAKPRSAAAMSGGAIKDRDMSIQRRRPQRHVGGPPVVDLVGGDDLMLGFLNRDELAEFGGLRDLAFPNGFRVRFEDAEHFVGHVRIAAEQAGASLLEDARHQRLHLLQLLARARQRRRRRRGGGADVAD